MNVKQEVVMYSMCLQAFSCILVVLCLLDLLPTGGRGVNYMHFSLCGNSSCWPVNIVSVCWRNVPLVGVLNSPHERAVSSLFTSLISTQTDPPSPPLPHQRLQREHGRAVTCLQACVGSGHVVSVSFVFTWDYCCVFVVWRYRMVNDQISLVSSIMGSRSSTTKR